MSLRNFPDANTSITLDFRKGKKLDPRITFERASSATEIGEGTGFVNGQVFEFQEDAPRLTDKGLLIEKAGTNFTLNSTVFSTGYKKYGMKNPTDNVALAPDGTTTAATMYEDASTNNYHNFFDDGYGVGDAGDYAFSIFVKGIGRDYVNLRTLSDTSGGVWHCVTFALIGEGAITQEESGPGANYTNISRSIESVGNGWYRIALGATNPNSTVKIWPWILEGTDGPTPDLIAPYGGNRYDGDTTKGYQLWGLQVEEGATFSTSYIPTSGAEVTRAEDICKITGTVDGSLVDDISSWFNSSGGTFVTEFNGIGHRNNGSLAMYLNFTRGSSRLEFNFEGTVQLFHNTQAGWGDSSYSMQFGQNNKSALSANFLDGSGAFTNNGKSPKVTAPIAPGDPVPGDFQANRMAFGYTLYQTRGYGVSGYIKRFAYYPTQVSNDSLEALTF